MPKLFIATPAYGEMFYAPYVRSLFRLQRLMIEKKWQMTLATVSCAEISESRNNLLTQWYDKSDASHILFVDADMGYPPDLIADMIDRNKPVVGIVYPKRTVNLSRLAELSAKAKPFDAAIRGAHEFILQPLKGRKPRLENGFLEVAGCGAGILLIQRSCIETMLRKIPDLSDKNTRGSPIAKNFDRFIRAFDALTVDGIRLSEDYSFCHRWRSICQGEIWARIDCEIEHIGLHHFKARYADAAPHPGRWRWLGAG